MVKCQGYPIKDVYILYFNLVRLYYSLLQIRATHSCVIRDHIVNAPSQ